MLPGYQHLEYPQARQWLQPFSKARDAPQSGQTPAKVSSGCCTSPEGLSDPGAGGAALPLAAASPDVTLPAAEDGSTAAFPFPPV